MDTVFTSTWATIIQYFFPVFTAPTAEVFLSLVTSWVLCIAKHTITGILPFADPQKNRPHDACHLFFPHASWVMSDLWRLLTVLLVTIFYRQGVIPSDLDNTLFHRSGRKANGAGWWRDTVRSPGTKVVHTWGLNLVVLTLRIQTPWRGEPLGLPINLRLHRKHGPTSIDMAQEMLTEVARWLPERRFHCHCYGFYASLARRDITYTYIPYSNDMNYPDNNGRPKLGVEGLDILWKDQESTLTKWKTPLMENDKIIELPVDQRTVTRRYTDKAIDFIKENKDKPFFVCLPHTMPHLPLYVPDDFYDPDPKKAYIRTMEHIDAEVGRLLDAIRELKLDKNTYVIFTSDNGPALGNRHHAGTVGQLRSSKPSTFEGGCRVPCIVWGPGRIPEGTECDQLVSTLDLLPSIAALTGTELPKDRKIDGLEASALFSDINAKTPRNELAYYNGWGQIEGIRMGKWKLLVKKNRPKNKPETTNIMLFDLSQDVGEKHNVADANPDVVKELTARMKALDNEIEKNSRAP